MMNGVKCRIEDHLSIALSLSFNWPVATTLPVTMTGHKIAEEFVEVELGERLLNVTAFL